MTPGERSYREAILAAHQVALTLAAAEQRALLQLLEEYAAELEQRVVAALRAGRSPAREAVLLREIALLLEELTREMATSLGEGVRLTARRLAELQAEATIALWAAAPPGLVSALFSATGARAAAATLARPRLAEAFVSIRQGAAGDVNRILRRGLVRGAPAEAIAREIRQYIVLPGSELAGDASVLADRRRIGYATVRRLGYEPTPENLSLVRKDASRLAARASMIARTEIMQAQADVTAQGAADSPVVAYIEIRLSATHADPCACEPITRADLYGFGPGRYDPRQVPPRAHPRCRCVYAHVLRPPAEWGAERGAPPPVVADLAAVAEASGLPPSGQREFLRAVADGRARAVGTPEPATVS